MKLRIRGNTIRLRLTRSEVDQLGRGNTVEESTTFPDGAVLKYTIEPGDGYGTGLEFNGSEVTVRVNVDSQAATDWSISEEVGLDSRALKSVGPLSVLIEKDFACLTPREGEQEMDTFPNPSA
ncbi:MAG: hypothetical protein GXP16_13735 [Gammaproteobacteria bacterium]|nr:hypothetical protein [Gammaproteobacteria bacterium]